MTIIRSRTASAFAAAAALSLAATPAMARDWGRHRHNDGIDAGDVFGGLLIIGGIAAIATAVSKSNKDRKAREDAAYRDDYRTDDSRSGDYRGAPTADYGSDRSDETYSNGAPRAAERTSYGVDGAVDACIGEVERGNRSVSSVDGVNREGTGWRVGGRVQGGYGFSCVVDRDGRVKSVEGL